MGAYERGYEDGAAQARRDLNTEPASTVWMLHEIPGEGKVVTVSWVKEGGGLVASVLLERLLAEGEIVQ